jgi:hypothetical protein
VICSREKDAICGGTFKLTESESRTLDANHSKSSFDSVFASVKSIVRHALTVITKQKQITTMPIAVGTKAPDFTLKSKSPADVEVKLSNNFGKKNTVVLFFPLMPT